MAKKKGICKNYDAEPECSLCKERIVQDVEKDNFVCQECGGKLTVMNDTPRGNSGISKPLLVILSVIIIGVIAFCIYWFFSDNNIKVSDLKVLQTDYTLNVGDSTTVTVEVIPKNAADKTIVWSSSNPMVAIVENGVVKAVDDGKAVIKAKSKNGEAEISINITVVTWNQTSVNNDSITTQNKAVQEITEPVESITVIPATCCVKTGGTISLSTVIVPKEASGTTLILKSSNPNIAEVSEGIIKGVAKGDAIIYVMSEEGGATVEVPVKVTDTANAGSGNKDSGNVPKAGSNGGGSINNAAVFTGTLKGGMPHGQGRLTFKRTQRIDSHDEKSRTANSGDYIIGEWYNGHLVYGTLYNKEGMVLTSINLGKPSSTDISDPYYQVDKSLYK